MENRVTTISFNTFYGGRAEDVLNVMHILYEKGVRCKFTKVHGTRIFLEDSEGRPVRLEGELLEKIKSFNLSLDEWVPGSAEPEAVWKS